MSTKILVTSEIATWAINWVNTTFNVSKLISSINTIVINGSEYAQYSFLWTTILLDDAPSVWSVLVTYSYESNYDFLDNSWWITWEVMSGIVNSNNKVFTSFFPISLIDEVRVDWVVVVWYSLLWNSILLASAPTTWYVEIDYFRKDISIEDFNRDLYYTKKEVRDLIYTEIWQDDTSTQYPIILVDAAINDWMTEVLTEKTDKSRNIGYYIDAIDVISALPIENSINTLDVSTSEILPPSWRIIWVKSWNIIDYTAISNQWIMSIKSSVGKIDDTWLYFVWYKIPKNIKRIISIVKNWQIIQDSWGISEFMFGSGYLISNWFIYLPKTWTYVIEVEIDNYRFWDDNSLIFIDKEDMGVVIYYARRQLYQSRESDKLQMASQIYTDKLRSYKKRMTKKRTNNKYKLIKTSYWLIP